MAKNSIRDFDNTAGNNTDIQSVDIAENCAPSGINNAIRELMADMADVNDGTVALVSPAMDSADINGGTIDGAVIGGTTPAAGTFTTLTASGDVNFDSNTLFVDASANAVGIGTSSPSGLMSFAKGSRTLDLKLEDTAATGDVGVQLRAGSGDYFGIAAGGGTGIGIVLDDANNLLVGGTTFDNGNLSSQANGINVFDATAPIVNVVETTGDTSFYMGKTTSLCFLGTADAHPIVFSTNDTQRMRIDGSNGNVGIGTGSDAPQQKLDVRGEIAISNSTTSYWNLNRDDSTGALTFSDTGGTPDMVLDTSGNLGIGTSSPSAGLHIDNPDNGAITAILDTDNSAVKMVFRNNTETGNNVQIGADGSSLVALTNATERMRITSDGDIEFPISTNALGKFADNIGEVGSGNFALQISNIAKSALKPFGIRAEDIRFATGSDERMRIDSSGNVGIGTSSPAKDLHIKTTTTNNQVRLEASAGNINIGNDSTGSFVESTGSRPFRSFVGGSERMRIDSSGNLLVGKTSSDLTTDGFEVRPTGFVGVRTNGDPLYLNRKSTDGAIATFAKDGSTVGSIFSSGGQYLGIGNDDVGLLFLDAADDIRPWNASTNAARDGFIDLGNSDARFQDIYATNTSIIGTSDQNEKQQIAGLTEAEITAAKELSKLFKTFKWNSAVESKGDNARTHTGHIAQEVQQAMSDAGLDAANYAFWCSDTWWETQIEVPAVEAVEAQDAVYDDDGNLVSEAVEAVEAQDAYTRTDTYDTAEEAPEGATERTRLGIRYPELLAFIGAATEQRLADIETRLTALETL